MHSLAAAPSTIAHPPTNTTLTRLHDRRILFRALQCLVVHKVFLIGVHLSDHEDDGACEHGDDDEEGDDEPEHGRRVVQGRLVRQRAILPSVAYDQ